MHFPKRLRGVREIIHGIRHFPCLGITGELWRKTISSLILEFSESAIFRKDSQKNVWETDQDYLFCLFEPQKTLILFSLVASWSCVTWWCRAMVLEKCAQWQWFNFRFRYQIEVFREIRLILLTKPYAMFTRTCLSRTRKMGPNPMACNHGSYTWTCSRNI